MNKHGKERREREREGEGAKAAVSNNIIVSFPFSKYYNYIHMRYYYKWKLEISNPNVMEKIFI